MPMTLQERAKLAAKRLRELYPPEKFSEWAKRRVGGPVMDGHCRRCDDPIKRGNRSGFCRKCIRTYSLPTLNKRFIH